MSTPNELPADWIIGLPRKLGLFWMAEWSNNTEVWRGPVLVMFYPNSRISPRGEYQVISAPEEGFKVANYYSIDPDRYQYAWVKVPEPRLEIE